MSRRIALLLVLSLLVLAPVSLAREYGVGVRASSQGFGAEGAIGMTDWFSLRGGLYGGSVSEEFEEGGIDYDGDLNLGGVGLMADFFPLRGKFHVSAGLVQNANEIEITATPNSNQTIGGRTYTPSEIGTLLGKVEFESMAPYAGIGWGNLARGGRIGFMFDLGVLHQGAGDVSLRSDSSQVSEDDLRAEEEEIEDDISEFDFWPVVSVGIAIRF